MQLTRYKTIDMDSNNGPVLFSSGNALVNAEYPLHANPASEGLSGLPVGFPAHLGQAFSWTGNQVNDDELHFVYHLTEENLAEVRSAKDHFKCMSSPKFPSELLLD